MAACMHHASCMASATSDAIKYVRGTFASTTVCYARPMQCQSIYHCVCKHDFACVGPLSRLGRSGLTRRAGPGTLCRAGSDRHDSRPGPSPSGNAGPIYQVSYQREQPTGVRQVVYDLTCACVCEYSCTHRLVCIYQQQPTGQLLDGHGAPGYADSKSCSRMALLLALQPGEGQQRSSPPPRELAPVAPNSSCSSGGAADPGRRQVENGWPEYPA